MGFNKMIKKSKKQKLKESKKEDVKRAASSDGFVPSTDEDLKRYARNGRKNKEARAEGKASRSKGTVLLRGSEASGQYRDMFARHDKFEILDGRVIEKFVELIKDMGMKVPRYREYLPRKEADGQFVFEVNHCLARLSWIQLSEIVNAAVNRPVVTREYSEAYNFAAHALIRLALGVTDNDGIYKLADLEVLERWPAETLKRPKKEDRMSKKEAAKVASGKLKAGKAKAEDEEDEDLEDGDEEAEDEVEDEDEEEDEDAEDGDDDDDEDGDEDKDSEDGDSDDEESEDEESDDEDEDKPAPKAKRSAKAAKEKTVKKSKEKASERSRPEKMKLKKPIPKAGKKEKVGKVAKAAKPEKSEKKARGNGAVKIGADTVLAKVKDRSKGGSKTTVLNMMPKKGITLAKLQAAAKEEGIGAAKVLKWSQGFVKRGLAKVVE